MEARFKWSKSANITHLPEITCLLLIIECLYKAFSETKTFLDLDEYLICFDFSSF